MSSWVKSLPVGRRQSGNPNGSAQQLRLFRRSAPYPASREDREDDVKDALDSYEELEQMQNLSGSGKFEGLKHQTNAKSESCTPSDRRKSLYQKFYRQVQEAKKPADVVVLSITNQCLDYPKSLSQCLQERGLSVEMFYLQAESGLTRALQDVRAAGSPLCILVEQTNVALSSCTVIIFSESLKIHRNMPKDQAMDFVLAEHSRSLAKDRPPKDPADIAAQASQLLDDFLDREKIARHTVPSETRQLLMLLAEGVHLYPEELETICDYVRSRRDHMQASGSSGDRPHMLPPGLGKPPPLLPTPPGPPQVAPGGLMGDHPAPVPVPLLPSPGSHPKSKPPPLLSLHHLPCTPSMGGPMPRGLMPPRLPFGPPGPPRDRGPLLQHPPLFHRGPQGPRGAPPSLKSSRPPLLAAPGPPIPRLSGQRH